MNKIITSSIAPGLNTYSHLLFRFWVFYEMLHLDIRNNLALIFYYVTAGTKLRIKNNKVKHSIILTYLYSYNTKNVNYIYNKHKNFD